MQIFLHYHILSHNWKLFLYPLMDFLKKQSTKFYQALISEVKVHTVTALLSMEEIKSTTQLPLADINFSEIR